MFFHSGKFQPTLVGFHLREEWVKSQTIAWAFIPQCSFFHKNHIMKASGWDSHLLLLLPRSCTVQSLPPSYTHSDYFALPIQNKKAKPEDLYNQRLQHVMPLTWEQKFLYSEFLYVTRKLLKQFIIFDALYQHSKQQEEHSMALYTCFLPKERVCVKTMCYRDVSFVPNTCSMLGNPTSI